MTDEIGIPETWHEVDPKTVQETRTWIQDGHPELCEERLEAVVEHTELRYQTARALILAHAISKHDAGLQEIGDVFEARGIHGRSARFVRQAIREHGNRFAEEILDEWGEFSGSKPGMAAVSVAMHALRKPRRDDTEVGSINKLAQRTGASFAWVHEIVTDLASAGWVETEEGVTVTAPEQVFEWWAEHRTEPEAQTFHVANPEQAAETLLHDMGIDHAITSYYAETTLQGHLYPRRLDTYVRKEDLEKAREAIIEVGGSLGGTNFRLLTGDDAILDEAVVGQDSRELLYAPLPQVILDLITEGGSAREAADMLIQRAYGHA